MHILDMNNASRVESFASYTLTLAKDSEYPTPDQKNMSCSHLHTEKARGTLYSTTRPDRMQVLSDYLPAAPCPYQRIQVPLLSIRKIHIASIHAHSKLMTPYAQPRGLINSQLAHILDIYNPSLGESLASYTLTLPKDFGHLALDEKAISYFHLHTEQASLRQLTLDYEA